MAVSTNNSRRPGDDDSAQTASAQETPFEGIPARPKPVSVSEDQQLATMAHMLGIAGCLPSIFIHRWARRRARFTAQESLEAANFTLGPTLVILAGVLLAFVPYLGWIFALLAAAAWLFLAIYSLKAAIVVNQGRPFVYRFNWYLYDLISRRRAERRAARMSTGPMTATGEIVQVPNSLAAQQAQGSARPQQAQNEQGTAPAQAGTPTKSATGTDVAGDSGRATDASRGTDERTSDDPRGTNASA